MANISSVNLPDGSSYNFKDSVSGYITDTDVHGIYYGTCATAAATAAKTATLDNADGFSLTKGVTVVIKFTYANGVANPTLNVDSSGAKSIKRYGTTAPSTAATSSWNANSVVALVYDGTYWQMVGWLNTTYSSMTAAEITAGTGTTARIITPANLKTAIQTWETGEANVQSDWDETDTTSDAYIQNKPTIPSYTASGALSMQSNDIRLKFYDGTEDRKVLGLWKTTISGISGVMIVYDDGSLDGNAEFLPDGDGFNTGSQAIISQIPTSTSQLTNDSGYITGYTETDPTVPAWAKASTKPSYTASEVGAVSTTGGQVTGDITLYVASGNSPAIIFQRGTLTDNYNDWKIYDKGGFLYFAQRGSGSTAFGDVGYIDTGGVLHFVGSALTSLNASNLSSGTVPSARLSITAQDVQTQCQGTHYLNLASQVDEALTVLDEAIFNVVDDCDNIYYGQGTVAGALNDLYTKVLPTVSASDNGKVLRVVNGAWSAVSLPSASGVSF